MTSEYKRNSWGKEWKLVHNTEFEFDGGDALNGAGPVIYVVDDEADTREILSALFEASGYQVSAFEDGESVLDAINSSDKADLIILDLMMPGIDGIETCDRIRSRFSSEQLPVIVASALDDNLKRLEALDKGADDYITKPFEPKEVVKRAEILLAIRRVLRDSELRRRSLEVLFKNIPIGLVQIQVGSRFPIVNPVARDILSLEGPPTGERVREHLGFDPLKRARGEDGPIAEDRKYASGDFRVDCRAVTADGTLLGCLVIMRDVTRELALDALKTEFAQVVSHELRTPLTALNNAINVIDGNEDLPNDMRKKLIGIVKRNTERMMRMVRDLLDLSKLQTGRVELTLVESDVRRIAQHVMEPLMVLAGSRRVTLKQEFSADFPEKIFVDTSAVERVLTNLLANAIKYTHEGTEVVIEGIRQSVDAIADSDPRASLLNSFARGYVEISVKDQGFGVPLNDQKRIFEKFVRVNRRVHGDTSGTGLGLSIAQSLVKAHGGDLWVESTPGEGAAFVFRLPIFDRYGALAVAIADKLSAAKRDRRSIGMIVLSLFCEGREERNVAIWDGAGDLAEVARGALLRSTDYAVFNPHLGEVVVILEGCMKEILPQVAVRVSSEIRNHFRNCCANERISIASGYAFSPPDSTMEQAMELLGDARREASAKKAAERRILIVDDDELFSRSTARLLSMYHFSTTCVSTAEEAMESMERQAPDLIIMDILMPELDGFRLALDVRAHPTLKNIPIVFISGVDRDDAMDKVFSVGGNEFLKKPIEAAELIGKLRMYMD